MQSPLRNVRKAHGFTLQHVAAGVQVNPATLSRIERTGTNYHLSILQNVWPIFLRVKSAKCRFFIRHVFNLAKTRMGLNHRNRR